MSRPRLRRRTALMTVMLVAAFAIVLPATAADGRLLATGGASQIEGAAGGGLVPWAVLSGYGTDRQNGATAFLGRVDTGDYSLDVRGAAFTWHNRMELSYAHQRLDIGELQDRLSLPDSSFAQEVFGAKLRLGGDLVYGDWPQVAIGVQRKRQLDFAIPRAVGAVDAGGTDVYVSATRLFLAGLAGRHLLVNGTLRSTRANQGGLLGFGGDRRSSRSLVAEGSVAVMLDPRWGVGVEYRQKPDNLGFAREDDWKDAFVAWFPSKHVSVVAAYVDLGTIATLDRQRGGYVSVQVAY